MGFRIQAESRVGGGWFLWKTVRALGSGLPVLLEQIARASLGSIEPHYLLPHDGLMSINALRRALLAFQTNGSVAALCIARGRQRSGCCRSCRDELTQQKHRPLRRHEDPRPRVSRKERLVVGRGGRGAGRAETGARPFFGFCGIRCRRR